MLEGKIDKKTHYKIDEESILEIWRGFKGQPMAAPPATRHLSKVSISGEHVDTRQLSGDGNIRVTSVDSLIILKLVSYIYYDILVYIIIRVVNIQYIYIHL